MERAPKRSLVLAPTPAPTGILDVSGGFASPNTARAYLADWKEFFGKALKTVTKKDVLGVRTADVAAFRDRLREDGKKPGTIARKLTALRMLFERLVITKVIPFNPADPRLVKAPKQGEIKKMDWLDEGEVQALLGSIDRGKAAGRRDYALLMVALHMGLRRSEAVSIRVDQFKRAGDRAYLVFRSKGEKERIVWCNKDLEEAFQEYARDVKKGATWLFPGNREDHLSGDQFRRIVKGYLRKAGIKKRVGTHGLRATFITVNVMKGTPLHEIQTTVGHSKPETTLGYAREVEALKSMAPKAMEGVGKQKP